MVNSDSDYTQAVNAGRGALDQCMGIEYLEARPGFVKARMPVEGNTQPAGLLHGGANVVLAESVGSIAASLYGHPLIAMGTEVSASHHRAVTSGWVTATCTPIFEGRKMATYHIEIEDDQGRRTCTARLTCVLATPPANAPAIFQV